MQQPIDEEALHHYLEQHLPEIQVPVEVQQVGLRRMPFLIRERRNN